MNIFSKTRMNRIQKTAVLAMCAVSLVMAQDALESEAADEGTSAGSYNFAPAPAPAPAARPAPAAPKGGVVSDFKADFDQVRGRAFSNTLGVANAAQPFTIADYIVIPSEFSGKTMVYAEPVNEYGVASFASGGVTYFLGLDNNVNSNAAHINGLTTIGMAQSGWGVALQFGWDRTATTTDSLGGNGSNSNVVLKDAGHYYGVNASADLGGLTAYGSIFLETDAPQTTVENPSLDEKYYNFGANAYVYPSGDGLIWLAGLELVRHSKVDERAAGNNTQKTIGADSYSNLTLVGDVAQKVASTNRSRLFVGTNQALSVDMYDDRVGTEIGKMAINLAIVPNILAEYAFTSSWLVFGGANHSIDLNLVSSTTQVAAAAGGATDIEDQSVTTIKTSVTSANAGVRYQNKWIAAEASLGNALFTDASGALFSSAGMIANFGVFLHF
jgi:hypothetical protein